MNLLQSLKIPERRSKMQSLYIILCLMLVHEGTSSVDSYLRDQDKIKICGASLPLAMATICYDVHRFDTLLQKRGDDFGIFNGLSEFKPHNHEDFSWPWIHHRARLLSMAGRGRDKRFIVEECCDNPCSREVLLSYC